MKQSLKHTTTKVTRTKPWNRPHLPVYSISSLDTKTNQSNMNIVTYLSAISMDPKRFMIAIYKNTKTLENIKSHKEILIQLLAKDQINLSNKFGKKSGLKTNKLKNLEDQLENYKESKLQYLKNALSVIHVKIKSMQDEGDHIICFADLISFKNLRNGPCLNLQDLKIAKVIR